jgi:uncharacterized protein
MRRFPMLLLSALSAAAIAGPACERHIEEPVPVRPLDPTSVKAANPPKEFEVPKGAEIPDAPPSTDRCVRPSPPVAKRKAPPSPDPRCPKDDEEFPPRLRTGKVAFPEAKGAGATVEIAENDHDRMRGLMFRKSMPDDRGMIFVFAERDDHTFWMHNTCIPLDMLFIDDDGTIAGIEENVPTMSDDTSSVGCKSKYVLELNAGWTRSHGVMAGQKMKLDGI